MPPVNIEYDPEVDALYVRLGDGNVARTVEDAQCTVDFDAASRVVGVEVLSPTPTVLALVAERFGFSESLAQISAAMLPQDYPPSSYTAQFAAMPLPLSVAVQAPGSYSIASIAARELELAS